MVNATPAVPRVRLHYPRVPRKQTRLLTIHAAEGEGIVTHPKFGGIVAMAVELHEILVAPSPSVLGQSRSDAVAAKAFARKASTDLFVQADTERTQARRLFADPRIGAVLAASIPAGVTVEVFPNSVCEDLARAAYPHTFPLPGMWIIHMKEGMDVETLAHEIGHAAPYYEGYPCFAGEGAGPMSVTRWDNILTDIEVDRRLEALGVEMVGQNDLRLLTLALGDLSLLTMRDPHALAQEHAYWSMHPTEHSEWRDRLLERLRGQDPEAARLGAEVARLAGNGEALRTKEGAGDAFYAVAGFLEREGIARLKVYQHRSFEPSFANGEIPVPCGPSVPHLARRRGRLLARPRSWG